MTFFDRDIFDSTLFQAQLENLGKIFLDSIGGSLSDQGTSLGEISEFSDNLIGNNGAIILTDDAQNTVNFIYVNPISFFNNGRGSDVFLNFDTSGEDTTESTDNSSATDSDNSGGSEGISGNVLSNNAAILLTDDAQNTVNFPYINPISFFNNGRAGDVYFNYPQSEDTESASVSTNDDLNDDDSEGFGEFLESIFGTETGSEALEVASCILDEIVSADAFSFLDDIDLPAGLDFLSDIDFPQPPSLLDALGVADEFNFADTSAPEIIDALVEGSGNGAQITDNVIGNNAAILLTDNAQSTVNFLYINPISFFNDGRAGDVYLNISLDPDDGFFVA